MTCGTLECLSSQVLIVDDVDECITNASVQVGVGSADDVGLVLYRPGTLSLGKQKKCSS